MNDEIETPNLDVTSLPHMNQNQVGTIVAMVPGGATNIQDIYPLSSLQEGMLFHHLLKPQYDTYVLSTLFELQPEASVEALTNALQQVIHRHDVLRSAVLWEHLPYPVQVVYREANLPTEYIATDAGVDPVEELKKRMRPGRQGMNLRRAPLIRLQIAGASHRRYALLQLHHVICDYRSWNLVVSETMAYLAGRTDELPIPGKYLDFITANRNKSPLDAETFFRKNLSDIDEPTAPFGLLELRADRRHIEEAHRKLDSELAHRVHIQSRRLGVSCARIFHAAWALVVARTSGRDDIVYGTVLSAERSGVSRDRRTLGLAVNTLPLRLSMEGITAAELLKRTDTEVAELRNRASAPLVLAQRSSGIGETTPLFTSLLNYRRDGIDQCALPEIAGMRVVATSEAWTNYPIAVTVDERNGQFSILAQADHSVGASRVIDYLQTAVYSLIKALDTAPQSLALFLEVMPPSEKRAVIESFNGPFTTYPKEKRLQESFTEQAHRSPSTIALVHNNRSLTYLDLDILSNRLAHFLRSRGVTPGTIVGLCVERSFGMVAGLLGILKAGGAYLPLDPSYPAERLQYMLKDAAPHVVLTQEKFREILSKADGIVLSIDEITDELLNHSSEDLPTPTLGSISGDFLYVIYTSGSTGQPKGTVMPHHAMANLIDWHHNALPLAEGQRVLQFAALSFDVAFQEIFSTLCGGGTLVIVDEGVRKDPHALMKLICDQRIHRLFVPPLMLQALAEYSRATGIIPGALKEVITAGEQLRISADIVEFFRVLQNCRLHNHYGPTETHVVTTLTLDNDLQHWPALPSIGRPIANTRIYLLDTRRQPVPIGAIGEIYIGGANLARGYLNRPELTAQRFLPDPYDNDPASRMYKTGDLGRWHPDGTIEYLGRNDDQVKIRGFRIELGEIETQLARHPQIRDTSVLIREDVPGEKYIVAYVISQSEGSPSPDELREFLRKALPDYMLPSAFVTLPSLPLTPSGKLNRRALPAPERSTHSSCEYEAPQGEVELQLATIWQDLLHIHRVGRSEHFFRLGGDSMKSLRLLVRIAEAFGIHLTAGATFEYPILYQMAELIEVLRQRHEAPPRGNEAVLEDGVIDL